MSVTLVKIERGSSPEWSSPSLRFASSSIPWFVARSAFSKVRVSVPDRASLVAVDVMAGQDLAHGRDTALDGFLVVGRAVLSQQVLEHVGRHYGVALHGLDQVLPNHPPGEVFIDLVVKLAHGSQSSKIEI